MKLSAAEHEEIRVKIAAAGGEIIDSSSALPSDYTIYPLIVDDLEDLSAVTSIWVVREMSNFHSLLPSLTFQHSPESRVPSLSYAAYMSV